MRFKIRRWNTILNITVSDTTVLFHQSYWEIKKITETWASYLLVVM